MGLNDADGPRQCAVMGHPFNRRPVPLSGSRCKQGCSFGWDKHNQDEQFAGRTSELMRFLDLGD